MTINKGVVTVNVGEPYNVNLWQFFKVPQGQSYIRTGYQLAYDIIVSFTDKKIKNPTTEDYQAILSISSIQVKRVKY